jgi:hypothetical protein
MSLTDTGDSQQVALLTNKVADSSQHTPIVVFYVAVGPRQAVVEEKDYLTRPRIIRMISVILAMSLVAVASLVHLSGKIHVSCFIFTHKISVGVFLLINNSGKTTISKFRNISSGPTWYWPIVAGTEMYNGTHYIIHYE